MVEIKNSSLRRLLRILIPALLIPLAVAASALLLEGRQYLFFSFLVASLAVLLFIAGFERKEIGTRRMVLVSVMIALSVVGRFIPFFKPVTALTVIAAIALGSEAGFLVGAFSALLSNFYFGQGPWTPFQMLAWGLVGLFAGLLSGALRKSRVLLLLFGVLSGAVFSAVMDLWTVLWYSESLSLDLYLSALLAALPHTALYAASNFLFLFFLAKPFLRKLDRIRIKYGA
jgi:energy-coupling factor transport system substrate-specific component